MMTRSYLKFLLILFPQIILASSCEPSQNFSASAIKSFKNKMQLAQQHALKTSRLYSEPTNTVEIKTKVLQANKKSYSLSNAAMMSIAATCFIVTEIFDRCQQNDLSSLLKNYGKVMISFYFMHLFSTIAHEAGHAFMGKLLTRSPIDIHINCPPNKNPQSKPWINHRNFKFYSVISQKSFARITNGTPIQNIAVSLAGPFTGAITAILFQQNYLTYWGIVGELLNFVPYDGSDGNNILHSWRRLKNKSEY